MILLKNFAIIFAVFLTAIIGQIILPSMGIFFLGQWPIFILVFLSIFFSKNYLSIFVALLSGILIDFFSGAYFGIFTLSFFSIALIIKAAQQRLKTSNPFVFVFIFIFCVFCFFGLTHLFSYVFSII